MSVFGPYARFSSGDPYAAFRADGGKDAFDAAMAEVLADGDSASVAVLDGLYAPVA
jgi:hypothetical protein